MAKNNQQTLAALQELVHMAPQFFAILSQYLIDPGSTQRHNNPNNPVTTPVPANSQIQIWTKDTSSPPLLPVAIASIHATKHVMIEHMAHSQHVPCHPSKYQALYCTTRTCCLLASPHLPCYKTQDMLCMPMKHVRFKTPALHSPGPSMGKDHRKHSFASTTALNPVRSHIAPHIQKKHPPAHCPTQHQAPILQPAPPASITYVKI